MRKRLLLLLSFIIFENITKAQTGNLESLATYFNQDMKGWMAGFNNFKLADFTNTETLNFERIDAEDIENINNFYDIYKPLISFSQDGKQFIDIYSYQLNLVKEKHKLVAHPEVDQAIFLCNLETKVWKRILFRGNSNWIEDVSWITNTKFILAGIVIDDSLIRRPNIFIGDTASKTFAVYSNTNKNCIQKEPRYSPEKLKGLKIQGL